MRHILIFIIGIVPLLSACGGGSSSGGQQTSTRFSITDAAVDGATEVWVSFTGIQVKPAEGSAIQFTFDAPKQIDLLTLQGNASEVLLDTTSLPPGHYDWLRLDIDDNDCGVLEGGDSPTGSYIVLDDGSSEALHVPSGSESGLKLNDSFTVVANGSSDFTVDFDLRKSVVKPVGQDCHYLKPRLRMVDNTAVGSIEGTVSAVMVNDPSCLPGEGEESLENGNAVYVFSGAAVTPDDVDGDDDVFTTAAVALNGESGAYEFAVGFVPEGTYTIAFTCEGELDDPEADDAISFLEAATVEVMADAVTLHDFGVPLP